MLILVKVNVDDESHQPAQLKVDSVNASISNCFSY